MGALQRDRAAGFERRIDEKPGTTEIVGRHGKSGVVDRIWRKTGSGRLPASFCP
jgi:hypothetical protein